LIGPLVETAHDLVQVLFSVALVKQQLMLAPAVGDAALLDWAGSGCGGWLFWAQVVSSFLLLVASVDTTSSEFLGGQQKTLVHQLYELLDGIIPAGQNSASLLEHIS
jgi:hypothetical protein